MCQGISLSIITNEIQSDRIFELGKSGMLNDLFIPLDLSQEGSSVLINELLYFIKLMNSNAYRIKGAG